LVDGVNVLAVEVHQTSLVSSDLVFGLRFDASAEIAEGTSLPVLDRSIRISEIMYNSEGVAPTDFIELTNISDEPVDLSGVRLSGGISFVFPGIVLQPNQFIVLAENSIAFTNRYGRATNLVGQYTGSLSNGGETIALQFPAPFDAAILRFDYSDQWYPETDGLGRSLEIVDASLRFDRWSEKEAWRASAIIGGSPGTDGTIGEQPGDFNDDGIVNVQDIDLLCGGVRTGAGNFDLDGDGIVNLKDLEFLVETILRSGIGDVNLDGIFNSQDLVIIFQAAEYEDTIVGNSTWADGDWNCDSDFTTQDLVFAFQKGTYSSASVATIGNSFAAAISNNDDVVNELNSPNPNSVRTAKFGALAENGTQPKSISLTQATDLVFADLEDPSRLVSRRVGNESDQWHFE
jgi:hypothetical protein